MTCNRATVAALTCLAAFTSLTKVSAADPPRPVLITGEVIASDSQAILVPATNGGPALLRNFIAEGTEVKRGDLVLRIDATATEATNITQQEAELEQAQTKAAREWSDLAVKALDAQKELHAAEAALEKAGIDAALPRNLVSAIDFDRYQGELTRARRELGVKQQALANAKAAVERRRGDGELEAQKLRFNVQFLHWVLTAAEVRAARDGAIVHTYSDWRSERFDEGATAHPGSTVGYVVGDGKMLVRAWALEADRPFLAIHQQVRLSFDALPGQVLSGSIERIASAPQLRAAWGNGRYFEIDVALPATATRLVPGMSVLVEPLGRAAPARMHEPGAATTLQLEGEIASRMAIPVSPPQVPEVWQFNLMSLPPEGTLVRAGETVAVFDAPDLRPRLDSKQSLLKEKLRALEKLELDHREAARAADIDVAEAHSNLEKAQRKVSQPKEQIRRVDYDKLVIDSELAQALVQLAIQQRAARAQARGAERSELAAAIARLRLDITQLQTAVASLTVTAKQAGMVLYRLQFNGEKFTIGNQVFRGLSVATLADTAQLMVRASVPEAQAAAVYVGQRARINVPGANLAVGARVSSLGRIYHIKSRAQPVIVRDVELEFDAMPKGVKPGAAVQIYLLPNGPTTAARGSGIASAP